MRIKCHDRAQPTSRQRPDQAKQNARLRSSSARYGSSRSRRVQEVTLQSAGLTSHPTFGGNSSYQCMGREEIAILDDSEIGPANRCTRSAIVFTQDSPREISASASFTRRFGHTSATSGFRLAVARNELMTVLCSKAGAVFEERQSRPLHSYFGLTKSAIRTRSARVRAPILRIAAPR